jgi:hypothetical protein
MERGRDPEALGCAFDAIFGFVIAEFHQDMMLVLALPVVRAQLAGAQKSV